MPGFGTRVRGEGPAGIPERKPGARLHEDPSSAILRVSGPLPGSVRGLTVARIWGTVEELAAAGLIVLADKGYNAAGQLGRVS
jgi:hypothetical protein